MATQTPLRFTVAFDEADGEGIVFFGNYFRLAHRAFEAWLPTRQIPWREWFANDDWGVPLRHVEADYQSSLKPGDEFLVQITTERVGESSAHFTYVFTSPTGQPLARLKTSHVFVSRKEKKKRDVPATIRERLLAEV